MHFKKLRLAGFKSFVEPAELLIEPGLTGIVGPNGCGKSNLVEALQWVMGEASARRMRGGEMDDVIFGGSGGRPARNIANVTLALDLDEKELPAWLEAASPKLFADARELDIERRIDRGKGSNYRVNGRDVRARDIQNLFADAASGAGSAALVGQGRISWLISAKPTERRSLLEEAAGISGLQARRHEAELKLNATEQNLTRVADLSVSLGTQIEKLKKQARQAEKYRLLSEEIRNAEAVALLRRYSEAAARVERAGERLHAAGRRVYEAESASRKAIEHRDEIGGALAGARSRANEAMREAERLSARLSALDAEERRVVKQLAEIAHRLEEQTHDLAREQRLTAEAQALAEKLKAEREMLATARAADNEARDAAKRQVTEAIAALRAAEQTLAEASAAHVKRETERAALVKRRDGLEERRKRLAQHHADALAQCRAIEGSIVSPERLDAARLDTQVLEAEAEQARLALDRAEEVLRLARLAESDALTPLRAAEQGSLQLNTEIKALRGLIASDNAHGFRPVLDEMRVAPGLEAAFGAALGEDLLASADPRASARWVQSVRLDAPPPLPEGAEPIAGSVQAPAALARRLARLGVVADAATGDRLQAALLPGQELVTRDGQVWRWDGLQRASAAPSAAATRLVHRNRLAELEAGRAQIAQELTAAQAAYGAAKTALQAAGEAERAARDRVKLVAPVIARARSAETVLMQQADAAELRRREAEDRIARFAADLSEAESQAAEATAEMAAYPPAGSERGEIDRLRRDAEAKREAERASHRAADQIEREAAQRAQRFMALETEIAAAAARAAGAAEQQNRVAERQARLVAERIAIEDRPSEIQAERRELNLSCEQARRTAFAEKDALTAVEGRAHEADKQVAASAETLVQAREDRIRAEGAQEQAAEALELAKARIDEAFDCAPEALAEDLAADPPEMDGNETNLADIEGRLDRLRREREAIGAVNLMAEAELAQITEERDSVEREATDLREAIQRLRQAIRELNREGRDRLVKAFDVVNGHFQDLFVRLFGGGHARLELTGGEDDPLQAGLEIMASPPGKKLQVLSLLSGGERALTAVALVFAMFLTNPAPICVLDEVDAPLDDANVERFCALVRQIGERTGTRFLIITHHRVTMARMDRLYGVTMMEKGVSRLVSVALREAALMRESA